MERAGARSRRGGRAAGVVAACAVAAQLAACATTPSAGWRDASPPRYAGAPARDRSYARGDHAPSRREDGAARPRAYNRPYVVRGREYVPIADPGYDETGVASWYGYESGRHTSNGEAFTLEGMTAAHRTLPIPSLLEVTNLATGARVTVRLNDRGPFVEGRLIDLSHEAARRLGRAGRGLRAGAGALPRPSRPGGAGHARRRRRRPTGPPVDRRWSASPSTPCSSSPTCRTRPSPIRVSPRAAAPSCRRPPSPIPTAPGPPPSGWRRSALAASSPSRAATAARSTAWCLRGEAGEGARLRAAAAALGFPDARVVAD